MAEQTTTGFSTGHHQQAPPSYPTLPHLPEGNQTHVAGHSNTALPSYPPQQHQVPPQGYQAHPPGPGHVPSNPPQHQLPQGHQTHPTGLANVSSYPPQNQVPQGYQTHPTGPSYPPQYHQHQVPQGYQTHPTGPANVSSYPPQFQVPQGYHVHPQAAVGVPAQVGLWSTGLFDCFDDIPFCCITAWCPCITFGQSAEIIDRGASSCGVTGGLYALIMAFTGFQFIYSCMYRTKLKQQYGIMPQDTFEDFCIHFWCHGCALCQEYRELQHRGLEPSLGWYGNVERMNKGPGVTNPPIVPGGMTR